MDKNKEDTVLCIQTDGERALLAEKKHVFSSDEICIQVAFAGLCRTDVLVGKGIIPTQSHRILGHECSGLITKTPKGSHLSNGMAVTIDPLLKSGFVGIERDGAFAEFISVPPEAVHPLPSRLSLKKAAFTEPVAAALAVFNTDIAPAQRGLILGEGRIASLTHLLLSLRGFTQIQCALVPPKESIFDFVIETDIHKQDISAVLSCLCDGGLFIIKSRMYTDIQIPTHILVSRRLRIQGVHYGSFTEAMSILEQDIIPESFFGPTYSLHEFIEHFEDTEDIKIFCQPNAELE
jgi:L-iditol 2-dehydrogenase